jgi:hypothetical protein
VLELFRPEIDRAMALGGRDDLSKLDRSVIFGRSPVATDTKITRAAGAPAGAAGQSRL